MPDHVHQNMTINLKLPWSFNYMPKIKTIAQHIVGVLKICYLGIFWACLAEPKCSRNVKGVIKGRCEVNDWRSVCDVSVERDLGKEETNMFVLKFF